MFIIDNCRKKNAVSRKIIIALFAVITIGAFIDADAEVFLRFGKMSSTDVSPSAEAWPGVDSASNALYCEDIEINDQPAKMQLWVSKAAFRDLEKFLHRRFDDAVFSKAGDFLRITEKSGNRRWLIVNHKPTDVSTIFLLETPASNKKNNIRWPEELPAFPPEAEPQMTVRMPRTGMVYGSFATRGGTQLDAVVLLRNIASTLRQNGWISCGAEDSAAIGGRGDIFVNNELNRTLMINFDDSGNGFFCITKK
jgi:hypothetical protein